MTAGHGDEEVFAIEEEVPRAAQRGVERIGPAACGGPFTALEARAGDGRDLAPGKVDTADFMVLRVGHKKLVAFQGHALRLVELGRGKIAVLPSCDPGADHR